MLSAKLAALCLCPALVATPAVIATHPKMRHAVAHMIHRAASRIDSAPVETAAAAPSTFCPPAYASAGPALGGLSSPTSTGLSGLAPQELSVLQPAAAPTAGSPDVGLVAPGGFINAPGNGIGNAPSNGIGGPGIAALPVSAPGIGLGPATTPTPTEGVTEPQNWALLITGFAATGMLLRHKRLKAA